MTTRQTPVNTSLILDVTIFRLGAKTRLANGLSSGSFPQLDVSMPRPSRLSGGVLGKIPTDKEAQQDHTLRRLTRKGFPDGAAENTAAAANSGHSEQRPRSSFKRLISLPEMFGQLKSWSLSGLALGISAWHCPTEALQRSKLVAGFFIAEWF